MINEEIITGLKNAVARKESLKEAMQIMINSGYDEKEVKEASRFVSEGVLRMEKPRPEERLIMLEQKKGFFSKLKFWKKKSEQQLPQEQKTTKQIRQPAKEEKETEKTTLLEQLQKIKPQKIAHLREIILIIILLILLMGLAVTIFFKGTIFGWFS